MSHEPRLIPDQWQSMAQCQTRLTTTCARICAETAWLGDLQAHEAQVRSVPRSSRCGFVALHQPMLTVDRQPGRSLRIRRALNEHISEPQLPDTFGQDIARNPVA